MALFFLFEMSLGLVSKAFWEFVFRFLKWSPSDGVFLEAGGFVLFADGFSEAFFPKCSKATPSNVASRVQAGWGGFGGLE